MQCASDRHFLPDGWSVSTKTGVFDRVLTETAEGTCNGWGTIVTTWMFDGLRLNLGGQQYCGDFINSNSLTTTVAGTVAPASAFRPAPDAMFETMRPLQVLLVDDDVSVLGVLTGLLESLGHAVISADNAADAELAFSGHSKVELLLSDYNLAETTGLILAKRFTAHKPQLRVILMSGGDPGQETLNEIRGRDWAFLSKPMSHSDLVKALRNSSRPCMAD